MSNPVIKKIKKNQNNYLWKRSGFRNGELQKLVDEAEAGGAEAEVVKSGDTTEIKMKFQANMLEGFRNGELQKLVQEAENFEVVITKKELEELAKASPETKAKWKKNILKKY